MDATLFAQRARRGRRREAVSSTCSGEGRKLCPRFAAFPVIQPRVAHLATTSHGSLRPWSKSLRTTRLVGSCASTRLPSRTRSVDCRLSSTSSSRSKLSQARAKFRESRHLERCGVNLCIAVRDDARHKSALESNDANVYGIARADNLSLSTAAYCTTSPG